MERMYGLTQEGWRGRPEAERATYVVDGLCRRSGPPREVEEPFASAESFDFGVGGALCRAWTVGQGPVIVLVHGQNGRAVQMASLARTLAEQGFRAVVYDAPGHGASDGSLVTLQALAEGVRGCVAAVGRPLGIVAHSAGAAGVLIARDQGLVADNFVFLAPPIDYAAHVEGVFAALELPEALKADARTIVLRRTGTELAEQRVDLQPGRLSGRALLIHDAADVWVPPRSSEALARSWPGAERVVTQGLGHFGVLEDRGVVDRITAFLKAAVPQSDNLFLGALDGALGVADPFEQRIRTASEAQELVRDLLAALSGPPQVLAEYHGEQGRWVHWTVPVGRFQLHGVTAGRFDDRAAIYLRPLPAVEELLERMGRTLPAVADDEGPVGSAAVEPVLPFPLHDDVQFRSPVLARAVHGREEVTRILGHATATLGERTPGRTAWLGPSMLAEWHAADAVEPLDAVSIAGFEPPQQAVELMVFMRPTCGVLRFRSQMARRLPDVVRRYGANRRS
ncbi:MAG: alpha/beta hydrolase [Myxococcales bacterium]|nr:alpha/beta hydrolase [Myxococcales bacterium]